MSRVSANRPAPRSRAVAVRRAPEWRAQTTLAPILNGADYSYIALEPGRRASAGPTMWDEMADIQERLERARQDADAQGWTPDASEQDEAEPVGATMALLIDAARELFRHTDCLESRMKESADEVTRLRAELEGVREEALTDALTGVANRKRLDEILARATRAAWSNARPLCAVICDIDHFKHFNDSWGHQVGDQVLRFVGQTLAEVAGEHGQVGRYGGEEFVIVLPGMAKDEAAKIAEAARRAVETKRFMRRSTGETLDSVTISLGLAQLRPREACREMIARADSRLYRSKHDGRNRLTLDDAPAALPPA